jgi:hypothetical protein
MTRNRASVLLGVLVLTAFGLAPRDLMAQPAPLGPETRVDVLFGRHPGCPQVAASRQGAAEVAWDYSGLPPFNVYVRHFAPNGAPTDAVQYPLTPGSAAAHPELEDLSLISYGFRVITRVVDNDPATPPKFFRRRLAPSGIPFSEAQRPVGGQDTAWVWSGPGDLLYAGSYQAQQKRLVIQQVGGSGQPTGAQIAVNTRPIVDPHPVLVAIGNNSESVVVWSGLSVAAAGSPARQVIRARRIFKDKPEGKADFDVNVIPGGVPGQGPLVGQDFVVAADARTEGFAVAWTVGTSGGVSIHLRLFDFPGVERGPETVAVPSAAGAAPVAAAFDDSSHLLLLWRQGRPTFGNELQALVFDAGATGGGSLLPAFDVASAASAGFDDQVCGDVAWAKDHWTIVWEGQRADVGPSGIFTRRFAK